MLVAKLAKTSYKVILCDTQARYKQIYIANILVVCKLCTLIKW
jgi:hypothetical protein